MLCEGYDEKLTGQFFANFIKMYVKETFGNTINTQSKLFFQYDDSSQISKRIEKVTSKVSPWLFEILSESPDINPIEKFFHLIN